MRHAVSTLLLLAAAAAAHAEEGPAPTYHDKADTIGQPYVIVAPDYPAQALAEKRGGIVAIAGRVSGIGNLEDVKITAEPPTDPAFSAAVKQVIGWWLFSAPTDEQCQPDSRIVVNRVEFNADDGKPHISVLRVATPHEPLDAKFVPIHRDEPRYPEPAVRGEVEAIVYVRLDVDSQGKVAKVFARAYSREKSWATRLMESEVEKAFRNWRYPPPADGKPWAGCHVVNFHLRD